MDQKWDPAAGTVLTLLILASSVLFELSLLAPAVSASPAPRSPICIDGDSSFTPGNGVNGGGDGTAENPYLIENWLIDASSTHGIHIRNTTKYFIIRNVTVEKGRERYYGIYLYNVRNGRVENSTLENNLYALYLEDSDYNIISGNTVKNHSRCGIHLSNSDHNIISGNTMESNSQSGIHLSNSDHNIISGNTVKKNWHGISLSSSDYNTVSGNVVENSSEGISLSSSDYNVLSGNIVKNNLEGITLWYSKSNVLSFNTCTGNTGSDISFSDLAKSTSNTLEANTYATSQGIPGISNVISSPGQTSAVISWTTVEPSSSIVEYGITTAYGCTATEGVTTSHSVTLYGLSPGTTYHFRVKSVNIDNNLEISGDFTFATPTPPTSSLLLLVVAAASLAALLSVIWHLKVWWGRTGPAL